MSVRLRYSNDHFQAPLDQVQVTIDGTLQTFAAQDTGDGGAGWDQFAIHQLPPVRLPAARTRSW